ncbi:MAG: hypothetical protein Q8K39_22885 [Undibacterium sp.]|nr:hypothetical protein [Undibacterium sp.]
MSWDIVFAHQGVRDAMVALINAHAEGRKLLRPMLAYIGLFAPVKTAMRYERVASLASDLVHMISPATIERNGRLWAAPADYWRQGFEEVVNRAHGNNGLRLPLNSHGYLLEVIAGYATKVEAQAETRTEQQRAGHAGAGSHRTQSTTVGLPASIQAITEQPRSAMPAEARQQLNQFLGRKKHEPVSTTDPTTT